MRSLVPLAMLFLAGCNVTNEKRIAGKYTLKASCATVNLVIKGDSTFTQEVVTGGKVVNRLSGVWSVNEKFNTVTFKPFLDLDKNFSGEQIVGATSPAELLPNGIHMGPFGIQCANSEEADYIGQIQ